MTALRALLRIAARDAWRHKARSILVLVMIGLPVVGATVIDVTARTAQADPPDIAAEFLGDNADARIVAAGGQVVQVPDGTRWNGGGEPSAPTAASLSTLLPPGSRAIRDLSEVVSCPHPRRRGPHRHSRARPGRPARRRAGPAGRRPVRPDTRRGGDQPGAAGRDRRPAG